MKKLHTTDIVAGDGQIMRQQMVENFEAIEQAINDIYGKIDKINEKLKKQDDIYNAGGGM